MLTDDELTNELGAAFRDATGDLAYTGRTDPPRGMPRALPVAAGVAVLAVAGVAIGVNVGGGSTRPTGTVAIGSPSAAASAAAPKLLTETMTLAGFKVTYQREADAPIPVYAKLGVVTVPDNARVVPVSGTEAKVWIGKDPESGDNALYVKAPTRNGGRVFALLSSTWTQGQLVDLFKHGEPRTVPAVG